MDKFVKKQPEEQKIKNGEEESNKKIMLKEKPTNSGGETIKLVQPGKEDHSILSMSEEDDSVSSEGSSDTE